MSVVSVTGGVRANAAAGKPTAKVKAKAKTFETEPNRNRNRRIHPLAAVFSAVAIAHAIARVRGRARIAAAVESRGGVDEFDAEVAKAQRRERGVETRAVTPTRWTNPMCISNQS